MDKSIRDYQAESVPLRRFAEPHEQGDPALFLISPSVSYFIAKGDNDQMFNLTLVHTPAAGFLHHWYHSPTRRWFLCLLIVFQTKRNTKALKCNLLLSEKMELISEAH